MALCSLDSLKEYIGSTGTSHDALMESCLRAAEREMLQLCHRSSDWTGFEASTGTRYYRAEDIIDLPYGSQYAPGGSPSRKSWDTWGGSASYSVNSHTVLWLGDADLQSVDTLTNGDGTAVSSTSYWLEPRNKKPYRYIRLKSDESWVFNTDGEVSITGTWGYSTGADPAIQGLAKEMAKYLYDARLTQTHEVTAMPDLGQITIPQGLSKHADTVLRKGGYKRTLGVY